MLLPEWSSFVGVHPIPIRHGLTIGELAILYKEELELDGELEVVPCEGWKRGMYFDETGLPWVMPSPNMPTLDTALVYPGQCLLEGTNLSEGRGTTHPFQLCGAPFLHPNLVATVLSKENFPELPSGLCLSNRHFKNGRASNVVVSSFMLPIVQSSSLFALAWLYCTTCANYRASTLHGALNPTNLSKIN